jgi:glycosyltransferase involved in cell wall biosynthesis
MPLAIVEAMLCGRPCIATNLGGIPEWIEAGRSGFIAQNADENSYEQAMETAWQTKHRWEEIGRQARERALQLYDPLAGKLF